MDPVRKEVCRKYVCYFFPEFKVEDSWRERIVSKINECLRRNDKRKRGIVSAAKYCPPWSKHAQITPCPRGNTGESIKRMGELISA